MRSAFPTSDYYGGSVPPRRYRWTTHLPTLDLAGPRRGRRPGGSHVPCRIDQRARCPAMPLRPRHAYAADLQRGLPTGHINRPRSHPPPHPGWQVCTATQPTSARLELVASLRGVQRRFLTYTVPSRLPDPGRLAVPTRPVVVGAACHPPRRLPGQAAPSFNRPAATGQRRRSLTSTRSRSASWRSTWWCQASKRRTS
jgi:hypothetical protein